MSDSTQKLHHVVYNQIFSEFTKGRQLACFPDAGIILADGLAHAHNLYGKGKKTKILFIVGEKEGNILDQRGLEMNLGYRGVLVLRRTFDQIIREIRINDEDQSLFMYLFLLFLCTLLKFIQRKPGNISCLLQTWIYTESLPR